LWLRELQLSPGSAVLLLDPTRTTTSLEVDDDAIALPVVFTTTYDDNCMFGVGSSRSSLPFGSKLLLSIAHSDVDSTFVEVCVRTSRSSLCAEFVVSSERLGCDSRGLLLVAFGVCLFSVGPCSCAEADGETGGFVSSAFGLPPFIVLVSGLGP